MRSGTAQMGGWLWRSRGRPSRAKPTQAVCEWGRRAAPLRSELVPLWIIVCVLDAGHLDLPGLLLLPPPGLRALRFDVKRRRRKKEKKKGSRGSARGTVDLNK